jgi:hypothetical protein
LRRAINHPELFEVARDYEFGDFQKAIQHVSHPGKTGIFYSEAQLRKDGVWRSEPLEQELSHKRSQNRL